MRDKINRMLKRKLIIFSILLLSCLFVFNDATAQSITEANVTDIAIRTEPEVPQANSPIKITLSSFLINLDNTRIEWSVDGKVVVSGVGIKTYTLTAGDIAQRQTVKAVIIDLNKATRFEKTIIIEPSSLDLLWEVENGYTNNFYKGKVLPVRESIVEFTAIPNRKNQTTSAQKNLIFNWKRNFDNIPNSSGYGKQSFSFKNDYLKESEKVEVTVRDGGSPYVSFQKTDLVLYNPILIFYQKKEGLGVDFWNALNNGFSVGTGEFSIIADPFFITPKDKNSVELKYTWKVNNTTVGTPEYKSYLTIRGDGGTGNSAIQLDINNLSRVFQNVSRTIQVSVSGN